MTLPQLYEAMLTELPELAAVTFYDHIEVDEGEELFPPFIFIHEVNGNPFHADNTVYYLSIENRIDVYTADRSVEVRQSIMAFLNSINVPFTLTMGDFDPDTMLYMDSFNLSLQDDTPATEPDPTPEPTTEG